MEHTNSGADPMQEARKIASSPAGQELIRLLQRNGGAGLQQALAKAAAGDYADAKDTLSALLNDPEAQYLLKQLGR